MTSVPAAATLDRRDTSITTAVVFHATAELDKIREGEILDLLTDNFEPFTHDIAAWCDAGPKASLSENPLLPDVDSASPKLRPAHVAIDILYATAAEPASLLPTR